MKGWEGFGVIDARRTRGAATSQPRRSAVSRRGCGAPSVDTLISIAHALDRNPRPLLIASGHIGGDEARELLREYFRPPRWSRIRPRWTGAGRGWLDGWATKSRKLKILDNLASSDEDVRRLAVDVFQTAETAETRWSDSWIEEFTTTLRTKGSVRLSSAGKVSRRPEDKGPRLSG